MSKPLGTRIPPEDRLRPSQAGTWQRRAERALAKYVAEHPEIADPRAATESVYSEYERLKDLAHRARFFADSFREPCPR